MHMSAVPGTSQAESLRIGQKVSKAIGSIKGVQSVAQWVGRSKNGADTFGTHYSEFEVEIGPLPGKEQVRILQEIRATLAGQRGGAFPGVTFAVNTFPDRAHRGNHHRIRGTLRGESLRLVARSAGSRCAGDCRGAGRSAGRARRADPGPAGRAAAVDPPAPRARWPRSACNRWPCSKPCKRHTKARRRRRFSVATRSSIWWSCWILCIATASTKCRHCHCAIPTDRLIRLGDVADIGVTGGALQDPARWRPSHPDRNGRRRRARYRAVRARRACAHRRRGETVSRATTRSSQAPRRRRRRPVPICCCMRRWPASASFCCSTSPSTICTIC